MQALFFLILFLAVLPASKGQPIYGLEIGDNTSLLINGSTSINSFKCSSFPLDMMEKIEIKTYPDSGIFELRNARLIFRVSEVQCGDSYSNKQLRRTLKSKQYPFILVDILRIKPNPDDWLQSTASIRIELAGKREFIEVGLQLSRLEPNKLTFSGMHAVSMQKFELVPPSPMMGLIKVNDQLSVEFILSFKFLQLEPDR